MENLSTFWQTVIIIAVLVYVLYSWWRGGDDWNGGWIENIFKDAKEEEQRRKKKEDLERKLRAKIFFVIRADFVKGYSITKNFGWVEAKDCESPRLVEDKLKLGAANRGANAIIKYHWMTKKDNIIAGYGKKGNPYYGTETVYDGEGLAVFIQKNQMRQVPIQHISTKPAHVVAGWVAIDGNNIFGSIYRKYKSVDESFIVLNRFLIRLKSSPYKPHVFWDGNFITFARALGISNDGENLSELLLSRLPISPESLTVSEFGKKADELIVSWASIKTCAIISGDNFSKRIEDDLILERVQQLSKIGLIWKFSVISGEIVVPELKHL